MSNIIHRFTQNGWCVWNCLCVKMTRYIQHYLRDKKTGVERGERGEESRWRERRRVGERERGEIGGENRGGGGERWAKEQCGDTALFRWWPSHVVWLALWTEFSNVTTFCSSIQEKKKKKSRVSFLYLYKAFYVFGWVFFFDFINEIPF